MAHFLIELEFVDAADQEDLKQQGMFLGRMVNDRSLFLAAFLGTQPGKKGIAIISAPSLEAAEALYSEAPLSKKGIIRWTITPTTLTFGTAVGQD